MKRNKWTFEKLQKEALKHKSRSSFLKGCNKAYRAALKMGVLNEICTHMPIHVDQSGSNNPSFKWTDCKLEDEALKYSTKKEFREKSNGAYQTIKKRGLLNKLCSHMPKRSSVGEKHYAYKWTIEKLQAEALKYDNRSDFQENSRKAYNIAHNRKLLDQICSHMKVSSNASKPELQLFDIIKHIFPKAQKLKITCKRNQSLIEGKPHIHGFDLDIYIPELRKGIEFNGKYWHSVDGLKRSREHWPEEDLINYHQIKSEYFGHNHDIEILHIDGEDWKNNKQNCVNRCLEFLGVESKAA